MRHHKIVVIFSLVLLMKCGDGASIKSPESSQSTFSLPWGNLFSLISSFATSSPLSYDESSNENSCENEGCEQDSTAASSETVIIYDVEQQVLPHDNATNNTALETAPSARSKRDTEESKQLTDSSEGRHKEVRPYPGYFLGRKLWYVPLWFGVYYSFYLTCLVVRSVARHRIHYPALLPADQTLEKKRARQRKLDAAARRITDTIQMNADKYRQHY